MRFASVCVAFAASIMGPPALTAQDWKWSTEDIDVSGTSSSVIADQQGNLHVSYYVAQGGQVKYAFRPVGDSKWYKMTLERSLGVLETKITVDPDGNPHICYTPRVIKYAHWTGRKWLTQEVDPGTGLIAYSCSIRVTRDGRPLMTWYLESGTYLRYAILQDGVWLARSIEGGDSYPGKWTSIALDENGYPRISYSRFPIGQLKFASFDGKKWSVSAVDVPDNSPETGGERGMGNSLVLDLLGRPMISYYDEQSLKVARFVDGQWKKETVERLPPFGQWSWKSFRSSLVMDSKGNPHIGFESLRGLEHAWWDGKQWRTQFILRVVGSAFFENDMTIDKDDNLYITFRDPTDGSLRLAKGSATLPAQTAHAEKGHSKN
jgi:hypothetical protein